MRMSAAGIATSSSSGKSSRCSWMGICGVGEGEGKPLHSMSALPVRDHQPTIWLTASKHMAECLPGNLLVVSWGFSQPQPGVFMTSQRLPADNGLRSCPALGL
jgi:hypothetical protein